MIKKKRPSPAEDGKSRKGAEAQCGDVAVQRNTQLRRGEIQARKAYKLVKGHLKKIPRENRTWVPNGFFVHERFFDQR